MSKKTGFLQRFRARALGADEQNTEMTDAERLEVIGRRASRRVAAPIGLFYQVAPKKFVSLDLRLEIQDGNRRRSVPCFLFDVNETGIAFACEEQLPAGSTAHIVGQLAEGLAPLVECDVRIVDTRPFPPGRLHPREFDVELLQVHGGTLELRDAMALLKATLDCVAHHLKASGAATETTTEAETSESNTANPFTAGTEVSFASLPVASVEVIDAELRRHADRMGVAFPLCYVGEDKKVHRVELHIGRPEKGMETTAIGKLSDYSTDGACIETKRRFEIGEAVKIIGTSVENKSVLFEDNFEIKNRRAVSKRSASAATKKKEFTFGSTVDDSMEERADDLYAYGLLHSEEHTKLLYKAIMDSVLVDQLNKERDTPIRSLDDA